MLASSKHHVPIDIQVFPRRLLNTRDIQMNGWTTYHFFTISILFHSIKLEGRRGIIDEFATILLHLVLFSAALGELAKLLYTL